MTTVERQGLVIDRPVEDVWAFMADISNMPKWEDSRAEWNQTSEGEIGVGSTIQSSIKFLGRTAKFNLRVLAFDPNRQFAIEVVDGFARGTKMSYLMEPVEGGKTRLRRVTEAHAHGLARLLRPFLAPITRRTGELEARNVKRILEAQH